MADEKSTALVKAPDTRPRTHGVLNSRLEYFRERLRMRMEQQLRRDMGDLAMSQFAFMDDAELAAVYYGKRRLTRRQQRIAKEFEKPKKDAAILISAAQERVINALRAQAEAKGVSINVERAVIRVPDTRPEVQDDDVVIDVEPNGTR